MRKVSNYPVRRVDFERNKKKHFQALINILVQYAVISEGVQLSVTNQDESRRVLQLSTPGAKMGPHIISAIGAEFFKGLMPVELHLVIPARHTRAVVLPTPDKSDDDSVATPPLAMFEANATMVSSASTPPANEADVHISVTGYISKAQTGGVGRSNDSSQFWFVNGRPVDLKSLSKVRACFFSLQIRPTF